MTPILAAFALTAVTAAPQTAVNPTGHWEGSLDAPSMTIAFQVDIAKTPDGFAGAITIPSQHLKGLPLVKIAVDADSVTFGAREDQLLSGSIDGKTMAGTYTAGQMSLPFTLTRTGDAAIAPPPASPAIPKQFEGTWRGALDDTGGQLDLVLTMTNRPDGTAVATIVNHSEGGLRIPAVVTQHGASITVESPAVPGSFTGELNAAGELAGTFRQGGESVPLTFRRTE